ncbi:glutathione S-transferase [Thalassotalea agariperforans]
MPDEKLPILYSLRNCPFAMRARIALFRAKQRVELREVKLTDKPEEMLAASTKGTVPILVLPSGQVIDESLDIMRWALTQHDPDNLLLKNLPDSNEDLATQMMALIQLFDGEFKACLEQYKCAKRYHEANLTDYRANCEHYLHILEKALNQQAFVIGEHESLADLAILPFIRQLARVERQWYLQSPYPNLRAWLNRYLQSVMFTKVMAKHPLWSAQEIKVVIN